MTSESYKQVCEKILDPLDIKINGNRPWDMQVHNPETYKRIITQGSIGLGESYMDGWWDVEELDQFFYRITKKLPRIKLADMKLILRVLGSKFVNFQNKKYSKRVAEKHYDLDNDFYRYMLDPKYMQYTCGYWKNAKTLEKAQVDKLNLICKKLHLPSKYDKKIRERILEFGCGFGGFANFATKNYKCEVVAYNISKEQVKHAREINKNLPVEIKETDYREAEIKEYKKHFHKIASIGMCEHVGPKNYRKFMKLSDYCLKDGGLFLLHTIGRSTSARQGQSDAWTNKYIFPGGHLPSVAQITKAAEGLFRLEDFQNIGYDYDKTLMAWFENFDKNWPKFKDKLDDRFYRMWKYYLLSCAGAFRSGSLSLFQFVFSKGTLPGTYQGVR